MKEIVIGGKTRPIVFGMSTLGELCDEKQIPLTNMNEVFADLTLKDLLSLIYHALVMGARQSKLPVEFTRDDVNAWIDQDSEVFPEAMRIWAESNNVQGAPAQEKKRVSRRA